MSAATELKVVKDNDENVMELSNPNTMHRVVDALGRMKTKRENEMRDLEAQMEKLRQAHAKLENEVYVIAGKQRAYTTAIRTLEDLNITR